MKRRLQSRRGFTVVEGIVVLVVIALVAVMVVPAVLRITQEKKVKHNLQELSLYAKQYFLENGKAAVTFDELVGPDKAIKDFKVVAGEKYPEVFAIDESGRMITKMEATGVAGSRTVSINN